MQHHVGKELESGGHGGVRTVKQPQAHIVACAPLHVFGYSNHHLFWDACASQDTQYLCFVQKRVDQNQRKHIVVAFGQQRTRNPAGPLAREGDLFAEGELGGPLSQEFLNDPPDFRRCGRVHADVDQVKHKELAEERERIAAGGMRVLNKAEPNGFALGPFWFAGNQAENLLGQIDALHENANVRLLEVRIGEDRSENLKIRVMEQGDEGVALRRARLVETRFKFIRHFLIGTCSLATLSPQFLGRGLSRRFSSRTYVLRPRYPPGTPCLEKTICQSWLRRARNVPAQVSR